MRRSLISLSRLLINSNFYWKIRQRQLLFSSCVSVNYQINTTSTRFASSISQPQINSKMSDSRLDKKTMSEYVLPLDQPVVNLDCNVAFNGLTNQEKLYAHYLSQASWYGGLIVAVQTSPESPIIISLLLDMFKSNGIDNLKSIAIGKCSFTEDEWQALLVYTVGVLGNSGNYKSFGDTKIIPGLPLDKLESLIFASNFNRLSNAEAKIKWNATKDIIYSLSERERQLGLGQKGITTYFSANCTSYDAELINRFMTSQKTESYMTRVFKTTNGPNPHYEIRSASAKPDDKTIPKHVFKFEGATLTFTRGDYRPFMEEVCVQLGKAKPYASNDTEKKMLDAYIKSFRDGSLDAHKDGSRYWIQNKAPAIETYIGFIETYRDPAGTRGEFEGFVSVVNRPMSEKFQELVNGAKSILPLLPWPKEFEKDTFTKPDFTSLDVLMFSGSGIPAGINIPNYDEIRQNEGFKNVSLGNVIPASYKDTNVPFLTPEDVELLNKYRVAAFEVQVGLHELLGHGSGKQFSKSADGTTNFNPDLKNPLTGAPIESMYESGDTYDSVFTTMGSAFEECRAECVGIFLSLDNDVLKIFNLEGEEAETVKYVNWLSMVFTGAAKALEMYQPKTGAWLQSHSQARFAILQVLLEAGEGLVNIEEKVGTDGKPDLLVTIDRTKIGTVGRKAIHDFLLKIQVYKGTADVNRAKEMFERYTAVHNNGKYPWASWREIVMDKKQPRKILIQHNTFVADDNTVSIKSYEATPEGFIESWIDRFSCDLVFQGLHYCWEKDQPYF